MRQKIYKGLYIINILILLSLLIIYLFNDNHISSEFIVYSVFIVIVILIVMIYIDINKRKNKSNNEIISENGIYKIKVYNAIVNSGEILDEGDSIVISKEGVKCFKDNNEIYSSLNWDSIVDCSVDYIDYQPHIFLSRDKLGEFDTFSGIIIGDNVEIRKVIESSTNLVLNTNAINKVEASMSDYYESITVLGKNRLLLIYKFLFYFFILILGIAFSIFLIFVLHLQENIVTTLVNIAVIFTYFFITPKIFEKGNKNKYFFNKFGFAYSKGIKTIIIHWKDIERILISRKNINVFCLVDLNNQKVSYTYKLDIQANIVETLNKYKSEYKLPFEIENKY